MQAAAGNAADGDKAGEKKRQTRGGKGIPKGKKKFEAQKIILNKQQRKGNKYVTIVQGLASNGKRPILVLYEYSSFVLSLYLQKSILNWLESSSLRNSRAAVRNLRTMN